MSATIGAFGATQWLNKETGKYHAVLVIGNEALPSMQGYDTEAEAARKADELALEIRPILRKYRILAEM